MKTREIADLVGGELVGSADVPILRVASLSSASTGEVSFLEKGSDLSTKASCVLVPTDFSGQFHSIIKVPDPKLAFARVAAVLHPPKKRGPQIHQSAIISDSAELGKDLFIGAFVCIGDGSQIGD